MRWLKMRFPNPIQRSQSGQALIILALGFIGLLSFVGLVTDVSIMLVRHNQLVRAVDSAALNAANQMRSDRSFAEVGVAARMMIEMHGFESEEILVETCASLGGDPADYLCNEQNRFRKLVRVGATVMSPTVFLQLIGIQDFELSAVSTSETAVLDVVMVMDVSESMLLDTTYKDWAEINYGRVYVPPLLEDANGAAAGTGILNKEDAAGTFDGSTARPAIADASATGKTLFPNGHTFDMLPVGNADYDKFDDLIQFPGVDLFGGVGNLALVYPDQVNGRLWYPDEGDVVAPGASNQFYKVESFDYPGFSNQTSPRDSCRVRFWPYSARRLVSDSFSDATINDITQGFEAVWEGKPLNDPEAKWGGFIPTFDFYGCCNDPTTGGQWRYSQDGTGPLNGNWDGAGSNGEPNWQFTDLICQPFKEARDATRAFLQTLDFDRGDRVALVTFDRGAFLVDPDGSQGGVYDPNNVCVRDPAPVNGRTTLTHMMASFCRAEAVLMNYIGVRAEPNFYDWREDGGGWWRFADGLTPEGDSDPVDYYREGSNSPSGGYGEEHRAFNQYPVNNNCPFFDATLEGYYSRYSLSKWDIQNAPYYGDILSGQPGLASIMTPALGGGLSIDNGYELRASCRGGNIGAGLREANNALLDPATTRRSGAVWVIVMLGDGGSGASDPTRANGLQLTEADPFFDRGLDPAAWDSWNGVSNLSRYGVEGDYGAFGLCPIGDRTAGSTELLMTNEYPPRFPYCSDKQPQSRHFCEPAGGDERTVGKQCFGQGTSTRGMGFAPGSKDNDYICYADTGVPGDALVIDGQTEDETSYNVRRGNIYDVDIGDIGNDFNMGNGTTNGGTCNALYDTDDYARDWADYVGLSDTGAGDEQLPTIFTIGFGLDFANGSVGDEPGPVSLNPDEYLGEELLRYIADVGDNFQIDTDYQQDLLQDQSLDGEMAQPETFGLRGPCEDQNIESQDYAIYTGNGDDLLQFMFEPLPPTQDCGNYYNAPDQSRLKLVFDDIASRMFTRLAP